MSENKAVWASPEAIKAVQERFRSEGREQVLDVVRTHLLANLAAQTKYDQAGNDAYVRNDLRAAALDRETALHFRLMAEALSGILAACNADPPATDATTTEETTTEETE